MGFHEELKRINWKRLLDEWRSFQPEEAFKELDPEPFVKALIRPVPRFVEYLLTAKRGVDEDIAIRDLYAYLLDKRYYERLNLLHFAFHVFDQDTTLPKEVVDCTPFPHEDGIPSFRYFLDPEFYLISPDNK
ncbi:MAG: hypothetical protein DRG63_13440 [Deltaproteobacteria bacterium]|nr:MAG: hypothetical protein DRG63_13440 [Deltaproteobacteria bacterium]